MVYPAPSHYLNLNLSIVNLTPRNRRQGNCKQNTKRLAQKDASKIDIFVQAPQCVDIEDHGMQTPSALLIIAWRISQSPDDSHHKRPVLRGFDVLTVGASNHQDFSNNA